MNIFNSMWQTKEAVIAGNRDKQVYFLDFLSRLKERTHFNELLTLEFLSFFYMIGALALFENFSMTRDMIGPSMSLTMSMDRIFKCGAFPEKSAFTSLASSHINDKVYVPFFYTSFFASLYIYFWNLFSCIDDKEVNPDNCFNFFVTGLRGIDQEALRKESVSRKKSHLIQSLIWSVRIISTIISFVFIQYLNCFLATNKKKTTLQDKVALYNRDGILQ